jgi:hypothetical protein
MGTKQYTKIVDERFIVPEENGGGLIKFEVWEHQGEVAKYSMVYINKAVFPGDNGRVVGYDNAHDYHHKHYFGNIFPVTDFVNYEEMVDRFRKDLKEFLS